MDIVNLFNSVFIHVKDFYYTVLNLFNQNKNIIMFVLIAACLVSIFLFIKKRVVLAIIILVLITGNFVLLQRAKDYAIQGYNIVKESIEEISTDFNIDID